MSGPTDPIPSTLDELRHDVVATRGDIVALTAAVDRLEGAITAKIDARVEPLEEKAKDIVPRHERRRKARSAAAAVVLIGAIIGSGSRLSSVQSCHGINSNTNALEGLLGTIVASAQNSYQRSVVNGNPKTIALAHQSLVATQAFVAKVEMTFPHPTCSFLPQL